MQLIDRVPKRVWITSGVVLALCGGVAAASAGSKTSGVTAPVYRPSGQVLKLAFAPPPPLVMPGPATDRLDVLAPPPADLANLDPDVRQSSDYAALAVSMKRYEAQFHADATAFDARPLPVSLTVSPEPGVQSFAAAARPVAHEDDVAATGDTGRPVSEAQAAD